MLRLSRLTDYAVTLLFRMEKGGSDLWTASSLAEASGLPLPTVAKILKLLAKGGLVSAQRGATGGYKLTREASQISIADIIEAIDGPIALTDCAEGSAHEICSLENSCPMNSSWNKVNRAVRKTLAAMSLAEMGGAPAGEMK